MKAGGALYGSAEEAGLPSYKKVIAAIFGNSVSIANEKGYHVLKGIKNSVR